MYGVNLQPLTLMLNSPHKLRNRQARVRAARYLREALLCSLAATGRPSIFFSPLLPGG